MELYSEITQGDVTGQIEDSTITVSQDFMNSAVLKYNKITNEKKDFKGSLSTIQDDIVAMMTQVKYKKPKVGHKLGEEKQIEQDTRLKKPPFLKHYKSKLDDTGVDYKVGDTKEWNGQTWNFCDDPSHKEEPGGTPTQQQIVGPVSAG